MVAATLAGPAASRCEVILRCMVSMLVCVCEGGGGTLSKKRYVYSIHLIRGEYRILEIVEEGVVVQVTVQFSNALHLRIHTQGFCSSL